MASFATPQRRPHKSSHLVATPVADEKRFSTTLPNAALPGTERLARASVIPIPLFPAEAPHTEAASVAVRGVGQARMSVKQVGASRAGIAPNVFALPPVQRKNTTGLPDALKAGVETLSGIMLDDVRVHYNSPKATGLGALAYAQGTEIHVGPGQEKHLPHEAWHTVQQKQGRVQPTMQAKDLPINDDAGLEREADAMGAKAAGAVMPGTLVPLVRPAPPASGVVQRKRINSWWVKEQVAFAELLAGKTDSDRMSASELQAVIAFLEKDDTGKGRSKDIQELKAQLEKKGGSPVSETVVTLPEKTVTPPEKVVEQGPTTPTIRPLPIPTMGGVNTGPSPITRPTTFGAKLTPPPRTEVQKPVSKAVGPTVKKDDEDRRADVPTITPEGIDAPKEKVGMLTVRDLPNVNAPEDGKNVFAKPPEYIPITFGAATTTGFFDTVFNVITLDPSKLTTADKILDTLSFETQNARQRSALTAAKQKGGGAHTASVEYESDYKYVYEALMSVHKVTTIEALVAQLGIASQYLVLADYAETQVAGGGALPDKGVLPDQAARQALWFFKTKGWNETQRKNMWGRAPHGEGLASSAAIYGGSAK